MTVPLLSHRLGAALLAAAASAGAVGSCKRRTVEHPPLRGAGVTAWTLSELEPPPLRGVVAGDLVLSSDTLTLAVAGVPTRAGSDRAVRAGNIVGVELRGAVAQAPLRLVTTVRGEDGREVPLTVASVRAARRGETPELEVIQKGADPPLSVITSVLLQPKVEFARVVSRVSNASATRALHIQVGDRVLWPGRAAFIPGFGEATRPGTARAPWVARETGQVTYGLAFPAGPATLEFLFDHVGPSGVAAWSGTMTLGPNQVGVHSRFVSVSAGDLARAAGKLWPLAGVEVAWLKGELVPAPSWARAEVRDEANRLVLQAEPDEAGRFELPAPPGDYRVTLHAPGGQDERRVRLAAPGEIVRVDLSAPVPGRLRFFTSDTSGRALPARWTVLGVPPTPDPTLDPAAIAEKNVLFSATGSGSVELPAGSYWLRASRGPEFSVHEQKIAVGVGRGVIARAELEQQVDSRGWLPCDFHLHAAPSFDSDVSLTDRVASLLAEGVLFAAATDHDAVTDYAPAVASLAASSPFFTAPGVEVTTRGWGHFNAFPYTFEHAPVHTDRTPARLFEELRARSSSLVIQVNHPRLWDIGYFGLSGLDPLTGKAAREGFSFDFDTIEVFNGFELGRLERLRDNLVEWFHLLNLGRRFTAVGSSDSHRLTEQWAGYPRTYVALPPGAEALPVAERVASALKRGEAFVTNGPFVGLEVDGTGLGGLVSVRGGSATLSVTISAAHSVSVDRFEFFWNGKPLGEQRIERTPGAPLRYHRTFELEFERDGWVLLVARGSQALDALLPGAGALPVAFTNPVFLDVDGDGKFTPPALASLPVDAGTQE